MQKIGLKTDPAWLVMEDEFVINSKVVTAMLSSISLPFFGPMAVFLPNLALELDKRMYQSTCSGEHLKAWRAITIGQTGLRSWQKNTSDEAHLIAECLAFFLLEGKANPSVD
jgi:hypothetical protein